jgi:probable rRNA maturation factor
LKINFYTLCKKDFHFASKKKLNEIFKTIKGIKRIKEINVIIVGEKKIKEINKKFLKRDRITDVISFDLGEVAEIYICKKFLKNKKDLLKLLFHGILHISGFDHKNKKEREIMEKYEEKLIKKYFEI